MFSMRDIYNNSNFSLPTKFTSSSRSNKLKDILPCKISKMITKTIPINTRIVISCAMKQGCEFDGKSIETETTTWSEFPNGGKTIVGQITASKEINKCKRAGLWQPQWDPSRKVNHLSKVIWDRKYITEFTRSISFTRIGKPVLMMDVKVSKHKNISRWVDRENLIKLDKVESKTVCKDEDGD